MLLRESVGNRWICEVNRGRAGFGGGKEGGRRRGRDFICMYKVSVHDYL